MPTKLLAWLQLLRFPNHFTAIADVLAGFLFVRGEFHPLPALAMLVASSWMLYAAGMVLNDVFDHAKDAKQRPSRPIPSGSVDRRTASVVGWSLLLGGIVMGGVASVATADPRCAALAVVLAALIVAYDGVIKASRAAPLVMGACRSGNLLLGMTALATHGPGWYGFPMAGLVAAAAMGIYITGVTLFARDEAGRPAQSNLWCGIAVITAGLVTLASISQMDQVSMRFANPLVWPALIALVSFSIVRRGIFAAIAADHRAIGAAVKLALLSVIVLDAALALAMADWASALVVLSLLVPALWFGRFVYST